MPRFLLDRLAREWELPLSVGQLDQFDLYATELIQWNQHTNLTSITDPEAIVVRHFLDSLALALLWSHGSPTSLADIGTGAGFPGVPLKLLWPDMRLLLVESIGKKTAFLTHLVEVLGLMDVEIRTERAETLGQHPDYREHYDLVTGRAVANLSVLAEYCLPLCRIGGMFVAPKSGSGVAEIQAALTALNVLGGEHESTLKVQLPDVEERTLIVVRKSHPTPLQYPRRVGVPLKRPLC